MNLPKNKITYLAGGTGSEILRRGFPTKLPLWSAQVLFDKPELLIEIYRDYIRAGADVITTNTFRTQRRTLEKASLGKETERINRLAVDLCVQARNLEKVDHPVYIAASVTTLEDCYRTDLVPSNEVCAQEHGEQIALLADTPIDFFLLETFNTVREAEIAAQEVSKTNKPFVVSFVAGTDGNILSGESWTDAVERLKKYSPMALLVNCVPPPIADAAVEKLAPIAKQSNIPFGVYGNGDGAAGSDDGWNFSAQGSPAEKYAVSCENWKAKGATVIGGCCGTTPEFTKLYAR